MSVSASSSSVATFPSRPSRCATASESLGVEEQIRVAALQRPRPERLDVLIQRLADAADLGLGDPEAEALDQLVDAARRDPADIGLLDDPEQRLLGTLARLEDAREVAAPADLGICSSSSPARVSQRRAR